MNALAAYSRGYTGAGVKVAVIDTGIDLGSSDFAGRIDPASADLAGAGTLQDSSGHGTSVARILAAGRDGIGAHGVAFDATIIAYRVEPSCSGSCFLSLAAVTEGIDRARIAGARVINVSMVADSSPSSTILEAVDRATAVGIIVTVCAGNEGLSQPQTWGAGLAQHPVASRGLVILVGAVSGSDAILGNRAGTSAANFITAREGTCSAATPLVSGALVLLAQANPGMSGTQLVDLLYRNARDVGAPGVDSVHGRGVVDLTGAFP